MRSLKALLQREWLQHRLGWTLLVALPFGLALLVASFAQVEVEGARLPSPDAMPAMVALAATAGTTIVLFAIAILTSFVILSGLARRDHGDRSIEFWLSLPVSHSAALGVPLATHLLLVPAAAIGIGWLAGQVLGLLAVSRLAGVGGWLALPWPELLAATLALALRLLAGLPLAVLWVLPIVMVLVLLGAWFKRWGWIVLLVGFGVASLFDQLLSGRRWLADAVVELMRQGGRALLGAGGQGLRIEGGGDVIGSLRLLPGVAWHDFVAALGALASPWLAGGLLVAAGCFALLVQWRQRGAGANG